MASLSAALRFNPLLADIDEDVVPRPPSPSWPIYGLEQSTTHLAREFTNDTFCFAYKEVFENREVFQAVSPGAGNYLSVHSSAYPVPAFSVSKCRLSKTIELEYQSMSLLQTLAIAIPSPFDFPSLLANYATLKSYLQHLETVSSNHPTTVELSLLVRDLLLDIALYDGIGLELYRSEGLLSLAQLHDMHQRSIDAGLDDLDACFSLGLLPDVLDNTYFDALLLRFTDLALEGKLAALHDLCEPIVRSGEVEWQANPELLLELLDRNRVDIYRYVLDLASRTRDPPLPLNSSWTLDITYDPLHVAIQIGHVAQVEAFLRQGLSFTGVYPGDEANRNMVLTPLSAAAFWGRHDIVRLILQHNPTAQGLQEAIDISLSNNDVEVMDVLLSHGVTDPSGPPLDDDTVDVFDGLNIESHSLQVDVPQLPAEDPRSMRLPNQSHPPQDREKPTTQTPSGGHPKEPMRPKRSRQWRHHLGRDLASFTKLSCDQLRDVCSCSTLDELRRIGKGYLHPETVWGRGMKAFRKLMQDTPPSALEEAIDSLLVSNAICMALFKNDESLFVQFHNDLNRWRSVLPISSHILFDEIALKMWAFTPSYESYPEGNPSALSRFKGLIESLLSFEERREAIPSRSSASGNRLSAMQRAFAAYETEHDTHQGQAIPGRSPPRRHSPGPSSNQQDDVMWADFIHMDRLEDDAKEQSRRPSALDTIWEDALSSTMILLASVAFSLVMCLVIALHTGFTTRIIETVSNTPQGYARSANLVAEYLKIHKVSISHIPETEIPYPETPSLASPQLAQHFDAGLTPASSFSSLSTTSMLRNGSSSTISSTASTATSIFSGPGSDQPTRGARVPCLKAQCNKTFSSVSNRNKHLREGCAFAGEKRQGHQCRNEACSKILTTKWYRDKHEKDRCRFRRSEKD